MNKIMFEMQAMSLIYQFYANIDDNGIVEYEIEKTFNRKCDLSTGVN